MSNFHGWDREIQAIHPDGLFDNIVINDNGSVSASYDGAQLAGNIGAQLGSSLGRALGGNSLVAQLGTSTIMGVVGKEVGQALTMGASFNLDLVVKDALGQLGGGSGVGALPSAAIGAASSLLMAEVAKELGIDHGLEGWAFTTLGTSITSQLVTNAVSVAADAVDGQGHAITMWTGFDPASIATNLGTVVASKLASTLAGKVVIPQHQEGLIGQQIGSSIGGSVGAMLGAVLLAEIPVAGPILGAYIGTLLGNVVGDLVGDLVGNEAESHGSLHFNATTHRVEADGSSFHGEHGATGYTFQHIAVYTQQTVNALADFAGAQLHGPVGPILGGGVAEQDVSLLYTQDDHRFMINEPGQLQFVLTSVRSSDNAEDLEPVVNGGIMHLVHRLTLSGGDPLVALAWQNSHADNPSALAVDLQVAKDYRSYLDDKPMINALMAAEPESSFTAGWMLTLLKARELGLDAQPASENFRAGNDNLNGTAAADLLVGGAGDDWIAGASGNDRLRGGTGDDTLSGQDGNDILLGEAGNDTMGGGQGDDFLDGGAGSDRAVFGGLRDSYRIERVGNDIRISGPDGVDLLTNIESAVFDDATNNLVMFGLHAPVIGSNGGGDTASITLPENIGAVTTVTASTDPGTTLTYSISGGEDAGLFRIDRATGALSFITAPDFENPRDSDHNNSYVVQVRASDGTLFDDQRITVGVSDMPEARWAATVDLGTHPAGSLPVSIGDFNGDGVSDVLWFNAADGHTDIWKVANGGWAGSFDLGTHPSGWQVAPTGDFNGDGTDDVLWYNSGTGNVEVWKILNGSWAGSIATGTHPGGYQPIAAGDFNHDGTGDVLWVKLDNDNTDVWLISNVRCAVILLPLFGVPSIVVVIRLYSHGFSR